MIKLLALDVDGVLTDGRIFYGPNGENLKVFHAHDGLAMGLLSGADIKLAVLSGRSSAALISRLDDLGIERRFLDCGNKLTALSYLIEKEGLSASEVAYMGDDLIDLDAMDLAGLAIAPQNAVDAVKERAHFVTEKSGGFGAVREAIDYILTHQGTSLEILFRERQKQTDIQRKFQQ